MNDEKLRLIRDELLEWVRLKQKHYTSVRECLWVGDEESRNARIEEDAKKEGYNQCLRELEDHLKEFFKVL